MQNNKMILEYTESLIGMNQSINIIFSYITSVNYNDITKQFFHDIILRALDPNDLTTVKKVIEFSKTDKELFEIISQTIGFHFYKTKNYTQALQWLNEIKQGAFVNHLAKFLVDRMMEGDINVFLEEFHIDEVNKIVIENSAGLIFINQYVEFNNMIKENNMEKAWNILIDMIQCKTLPTEYTGRVLEEALIIIKSIQIDIEQWKLMSQTLTDYEFKYKEKKNKERVQIIRLVLMKAYRNAVINE